MFRQWFSILTLTIICMACSDDLRIQTVSRENNAALESFEISSAANLTTNTSYTLAWSPVKGVGTYEVVIAKNADCTDEIFQKKNLSDTTLLIDFLGDAQYYLCVFTERLGKRLAAANNGISLVVDTRSPVAQVPTIITTWKAAFDPEITIDDLSPVAVQWSQVSGPGTVAFGDANALKPKVTASIDGIYRIKAILTDQAGNKSESIYTFVWDSTAPLVEVGPSLSSNQTISLNPTVDASAVSYRWNFANGPEGGTVTFSDSKNKTVTLSADVPGTYTISLLALDEVGNIGVDSFILTWLPMPPHFTSVALSGPASDAVINAQEKTANIDILTSLVSELSTQVRYKIVSNTTTCDSALVYSAGVPQASSFASLSDGSYKICIELSNAGPVIAYGESSSIVFDGQAPSFVSLAGASAASDGKVSASEANTAQALWTLNASGATQIAFTVALDDATPFTCDASQTYDQSTIPLISSISSDGSYALCVRLSDAAGNISYGKSQTIMRDIIAPVFTSLTAAAEGVDLWINSSETTGTQALWALNAAGVTTTQYTALLADPSASVVCDASQTYDQGTTVPTATAMLSDNNWTICVKLSDTVGNVTYGKGAIISRDIVVPVFTSLIKNAAASDGYINDSEKLLVSALMTLSASGQTQTAYTLALDDSSSGLTCNSGQTYNQSSIPTPASMVSDGTFAICVRLMDPAGNTVYGKSDSLTRDTLAPSVTTFNGTAEASDHYIVAGEENSTSPLYSLVAIGASSTAFTLALSDPTSAVLCDGTQSYGQSSIPLINSLGSDGIYAVCVRLIDAAANTTYAKSHTVQRYLLGPAFGSLAGAHEASNGYINNSEKNSVQAAWTLSAAAYTVVSYTVPLDDSGTPVTCDVTQNYNQSAIATVSTISSDGIWVICAKLDDSIGNHTYGKSASITRDIIPPTFTSLNGANAASDLYIKSSETSASTALFTLTASVPSTASYTATLSDDPTPISCDVSQTYNLSSIPLASSLASDGKYAVCVRLTDAAGNMSYGKSQQVERDTVAPTLTSLLGANEASDGYIKDSEKASVAAAWALLASGQSSSAYTAALDDSGTPVSCDPSQNYSLGTIPPISSMASDSQWAICVELVDAAGNTTYGKSQTLIRDTSAPTFTSLAVANAASDSYINTSERLLVNTMWTLTASNYSVATYSSAASDSGSSLVCNGSTNYDQSSIATPSTLSSDGVYGICVQLSDAAGNLAYGKSSPITRDTIAPTFTSLLGANEASDLFIKNGEEGSSSGLYALIASGQNGAAYTLALSDSPTPISCTSSQVYGQTAIALISSLSSDGSYALCVELSDLAGNKTYGKSQTVVRDVIAPVFTSLLGTNEAADGLITFYEKDATNAAWVLSGSGYASENYSVVSNDAANALVCDGSLPYSGTSIPLVSAISSDGTWGVCVKLRDAAGNITYGKSQQLTRDITPLSAPASLVATAGNRIIDTSWSVGGGIVAGYILVRGPAGSAPTFVPSTGQTYTIGAQGSDRVVYVGTKRAAFESALTIGSTYTYKIYSYDAAMNYSTANTATATPSTDCPSNWVFVPGDMDYGTPDFCIMKFEAKNVGTVATSQAATTPWNTVSPQKTAEYCEALGPGYALISNDEWMTAASLLSSEGRNWSGLAVGSGNLMRGHSDNNPALGCYASTNDSQAYVEGADCTSLAAGGGENSESTQRRTFYFPSGEIIWDLAGNYRETLLGFVNNDKPYSSVTGSATAAYFELPAIDSSFNIWQKRDLVPTNGVKSFWNDAWDYNEGVGRYYPDENGSFGVPDRGGAYDLSSANGIFGIHLNKPFVFSGHSRTGFRCIKHLADADPATLSLASSSSALTASWTAVGGASGYMLVRGAAGAYPTFIPAQGTTYSAGAQGSDQILYVGTALSYADTGLENGVESFYALYSYDASRIYAAPVRAKDRPMGCPSGFVLVPGDTDYGTNDFCVMKYEAKSKNGSAITEAAGTPWVSLAMENAMTACDAIGPGYHLISNMEWMTLGANAAGVASNWSNGAVGDVALQRGHTDNNPTTICAASSDDSLAFVETTCTPIGTGAGEDAETSQRRTMNLANGAVVWDLSGNVSEWTSGMNITNKPGATAAYYEYTALTPTSTTPLANLVPTHAIKSYWSDTWDSSYGLGQFYPGANASGGFLTRGAAHNTNLSGLFTADFSLSSSSTSTTTGFRCVLGGSTSNTPLNFAATSTVGSLALTWSSGGTATTGYVLVRGEVNKWPGFQPASGTLYSAGAQGKDVIVYAGTNTSYTDTSISQGSTYNYRLYAYDAATTYSSPTSLAAAQQSGLVFELDASKAGATLLPGDNLCSTTGSASWLDRIGGVGGTLTNFASPSCSTTSGWNGEGTSSNPHRLSYDGVDDRMSFGQILSLPKHTIIAWVRRTGAGISEKTGNGGVQAAVPIVAKGAPEGETAAVDVNYYLGVDASGYLATDYETTGADNKPLISTSVVTLNQWVMVALSFDYSQASRTLYLNGSNVASDTESGAPRSSTSTHLSIGSVYNSDGTARASAFAGDISRVQIFDRALTAAEIAAACAAYSVQYGVTCAP